MGGTNTISKHEPSQRTHTHARASSLVCTAIEPVIKRSKLFHEGALKGLSAITKKLVALIKEALHT